MEQATIPHRGLLEGVCTGLWNQRAERDRGRWHIQLLKHASAGEEELERLCHMQNDRLSHERKGLAESYMDGITHVCMCFTWGPFTFRYIHAWGPICMCLPLEPRSVPYFLAK